MPHLCKKASIDEDKTDRRLRMLPIGDLMPNPNQPRKTFNEQALEELSESIKKNGILQPLIVSSVHPEEETDDRFVIVAGERRWRAAQSAGLHEVPALVKKFDLRQRSEVAIVENIQREDLSSLELAEAYKDLIERFGYRQEDLAQTLGKNRSTITNSMRLLSLPESVKEKLQNGTLSEGHARLLVGLDDAERMAESFVKKGITVRVDTSRKTSAKQVSVKKLQKEADSRLPSRKKIKSRRKSQHQSPRARNRRTLRAKNTSRTRKKSRRGRKNLHFLQKRDSIRPLFAQDSSVVKF